MQTPADFERLLSEQLGAEEYQALARALDEEPVTSIRLNRGKPENLFADAVRVPWCEEGRYLTERPSFTLDPLLHAGCYYVQEASSMFLSHLLKTYLPVLLQASEAPICLDLCAAPGGKSTLLLNELPPDATLFANEPIRQRANILRENIIKWGHPNAIVTSNYAADFQFLGEAFDLILCDAPCSGEGMFRKDPESIQEWSLQNVEMCWRRQREIVQDIWPTLRSGGLFIYSTCTYNHFEDEDNVAWMAETFGADILPLQAPEEWGIRNGHFFPHHTRGEGFYIAILQKHGDGKRKAIDLKKMRKRLNVLLEGIEPGRIVDKKGTVEPSHSQAMDIHADSGQWPTVELSLEEALDYLRTEALHLPPSTPRGYVLLTYRQHPLGFCKNIGNRANNLYPTAWRIRKK